MCVYMLYILFRYVNSILSVGKCLKGTNFYVHSDLPKEVEESCKLLCPFFLAACTNNEKSTHLGTHLCIGNIIFEVSDTASFTIHYPHDADKQKSLNL